MKITKFGHSCFLIEDGGARVLFDPGDYSTSQNTVKNLDAVIITHSHSDHFDEGSLKEVMAGNPEAIIITNTEVKNLLKNENYKVEIVEDGGGTNVKGMKIQAFGNDHMQIYTGIIVPQCTGYLINGKLFNSSDNFNKPGVPVEILIIPFTAPWIKLSEFFDYVKMINPKKVLAAHDGNMKEKGICGKIAVTLEKSGIKFIDMELNKEYDL